MAQGLDHRAASPEGYQSAIAICRHLPKTGLEPGLVHPVFLRISKINGCAYRVDRHWQDALAWAEALTLIGETRAPDADHDAALAEFGDRQTADLSFAITAMNGLNRIGIGFRQTPKEG